MANNNADSNPQEVDSAQSIEEAYADNIRDGEFTEEWQEGTNRQKKFTPKDMLHMQELVRKNERAKLARQRGPFRRICD